MATADLSLRIDSGGIGDLADVMTTMADAFDPEFGEAWTEAQCAGILGMPGSWLLIARSGDDPAGFALVRDVAGEAELLLIAVRHRYRRLGVGRALLDQVSTRAREQSIDVLHLEVRQDNPAMALYRAAGFVEAGIRRGYYRGRTGKVFDALTFRRDLGHN